MPNSVPISSPMKQASGAQQTKRHRPVNLPSVCMTGNPGPHRDGGGHIEQHAGGQDKIQGVKWDNTPAR